jgi:CYTH domain-containing protein
MGIEIERKFLVHPEALVGLLGNGTHITQGYLSFNSEVRVRVKRDPRTKRAPGDIGIFPDHKR